MQTCDDDQRNGGHDEQRHEDDEPRRRARHVQRVSDAEAMLDEHRRIVAVEIEDAENPIPVLRPVADRDRRRRVGTGARSVVAALPLP